MVVPPFYQNQNPSNKATEKHQFISVLRMKHWLDRLYSDCHSE